MARAVFIIDDMAVASFIGPGGEVKDLVDDVARNTYWYSRAYVSRGHVRSGRLLRGLGWKQAVPSGHLKAKAHARSTAKHTWYFMKNTLPTVKPKGPYLLVPKKRGAAQKSPATKGAGHELFLIWDAKRKTVKEGQRKPRRGFYRPKKVKGYKAHPFLQEGLDKALRIERLWTR